MRARLTRRHFLAGGVAVAGTLALRPLRAWADPALPASTLRALDSSPFVYVSPLKSDGGESRCHAEVWYAWIDGAVVMTVSSERWKATSIEKGLLGARIWVGDAGRLKGLGSGSQDFRKLPTFDARAEKLQDAALLDRLLAAYDTKYPEEIGEWRGKMREGHAAGTRVLIRYVPA